MRSRLLWALALFALTASAHMISISTGEVALNGAKLHYTLRMPAYEVANLADPVRSLLLRIEFPDAKRLDGSCRIAPQENALICDADFEFPAAPKSVRVRSRLHEVTVTNHVHLVNAVRDKVVDQAVLEVTSPEAEIRFVPLGPAEAAYQQFSAGARRAAAGPPQILFLIALVVAARSLWEFGALSAAFAIGQGLALFSGSVPSPKFVEAAAALAVAYLAVEIVFLPDARHRWAVVGLLGILQGLAYTALVDASHFSPGWVLTGALLVELLVLGAAGLIWNRLPVRPARPIGWVMLAIGVAWFGWRLAV